MEDLLRELAEINAASQVRSDYLKTLALLRALKAGRLAIGDVELLPDGWRLVQPAPAEPQPEATATPEATDA